MRLPSLTRLPAGLARGTQRPSPALEETRPGRTASIAGGLLSDGGSTIAVNSIALAVNLLTGILIARGLGPAGRGQVTAVMTSPQLIGWLFAMGCAQAVCYYQARNPSEGPRLLGTWLVMLVPLALAGLLAGELLLPLVLAAQGADTLRLAQIYMLTLLLVPLGDLMYGLFVGDHDFLFYNVWRLSQPLATAGSYVVLWAAGILSVRSALAASAAVTVVVIAWGSVAALRRFGIAKPSPGIARTTLWYGVRAHGTNVSDVLNGRLDLLLIPAFLGASTIGLYAVASAVAGVVVALAASLSLLVLPIAARGGKARTEAVARLTRVTGLLAISCAVATGIGATLLTSFIYGSGFGASVAIIWLLLPGTAAYAVASALRSALLGAGKPLAATASYAAGLVVTVVGLAVFLRGGGIVAAALVSTASYFTVLTVSLILYSRESGLGLTRFVPTLTDIRPIATAVKSLVRP